MIEKLREQCMLKNTQTIVGKYKIAKLQREQLCSDR